MEELVLQRGRCVATNDSDTRFSSKKVSISNLAFTSFEARDTRITAVGSSTNTFPVVTISIDFGDAWAVSSWV